MVTFLKIWLNKRKLLLTIIIILITISIYYIKATYFFPGYKYVGHWIADKSIVTITHEGNHFIIKAGGQFLSANLNKYEQLEIEYPSGSSHGKITYLESNDALQFGSSYFKRNQNK